MTNTRTRYGTGRRGARGSFRVTIAAAAFAAFALPVGAASAAHDQPAKAKTMLSDLVTGYAPCTAPNTTVSDSLSLPACTPPVRYDSKCGFGGTGSGTVKAVVTGKESRANGDIQVSAKASGITGCEGETLCLVAAFRGTLDNCPEGSCTTIDVPSFIIGSGEQCCVVTGGVCKLKTTVNTVAPGAVNSGKDDGAHVLGWGLQRTTGSPAATGPTFGSGLLVP